MIAAGVVATDTAAAKRFIYTDLAPEAEAIARSAAAAIKSVTARSVVEIGRQLLLAKESLPHGTFTLWAETELGITGRACRNYMAASRWLEGKTETVSVLPPSIIYRLANPATPSKIVDEVVALGAVGAIDHDLVRSKLSQFEVERTELRYAQRRNSGLTAAELRERRQKQQERERRENARVEAERERDRSERRSRLTPLTKRVTSLGRADVEVLLAAVRNYQDQVVLVELLREFIAATDAASI